MELSKEQSSQLYDMLQGIAQKKYYTYKYYGIDIDDMTSELWIRANKDIDKLGKFEPNLIAKSAYDDIVDIIRYNHRRLHKNVDPDTFDYDPELTQSSKNMTHNATELADLNDVLSAFGTPDTDFPSPNSKSKEYWYVWLLLKLEVEHDKEVISKILDMPENAWMKKPRWVNKWPVDDIIATTIGYAGNHSTGFQKVKNRARNTLTELGFN